MIGRCSVLAAFAVLGCVCAQQDCVVNTTKVYMPSRGSGDCYCGGAESASCDWDPQYRGLSKSGCKMDASDFKVGSAEGTCGWFCLCANAQVANGKLTGVTCCAAGKKFGLVGNKVIGQASAPAAKVDPSEVVPSGSFAICPLASLLLVCATMARRD